MANDSRLAKSGALDRDWSSFLQVQQVCPASDVGTTRGHRFKAPPKIHPLLFGVRSSCQHHVVPGVDFSLRMPSSVLDEPVCGSLIRRSALDRLSELIRRQSGKVQQPFIHRTGIDVFSMGASQDSSAFVNHPSQVHIASQFRSHAAWVVGSQVHVRAFYDSQRRGF